MFYFLEQFSPLVQTLFGTGFTWGMMALGAAVIIFGRRLNRKILDWMLGFAIMMTLDVAFG